MSARRSTSDPTLTYLLDENLGGIVIASALKSAGASIEVHSGHFPAGTPDGVWLQTAATRRWIVLTRDQKIRIRPNEIAVIEAVGAREAYPAANVLAVTKTGKISQPSAKKTKK